MKKRKFYRTTLALLVILFTCVLTFTACDEKDHEHAWSEWNTVKNANCTETGVEERICSECGETETASITEFGHDWIDATCFTPKTCNTCSTTEGSALGHTPNADDGDCTTEIICSVCGEVTTSAKPDHMGGNATCEHKAQCSVCGKEYGELAEHTPNENDGDCTTEITCSVCDEVIDGANTEHTGGTATCEHKAQCSACGKEYGELAEHTPNENDGDCTTEITCSVCGAVLVDANFGHIGGKATCEQKAQCSVCGKEYGEIAEHTPNEDDGDCTTEITCFVCGRVTTPANTGHTGGAADCMDKAQCSVCGKEYGELAEHTPDEDDGDCMTEIFCSVCGNWATPAGHKFENDVCTVCESERASEGLIYWLSEDATYYTVSVGSNCTDTYIIIPGTYQGKPVRKIADNAIQFYYDKSSLTGVKIPDSITTIGAQAFYGCSNMTSITIPDSVTSIGEYAFDGCTGVIQIENGVFYVDKWVIDYDGSINDEVSLRANTVGIGYAAFCSCGFTSITIPSSVTIINDRAFWGCQYLTSIELPKSVKTIGKSAFRECTSLTSINIPTGVESIDDYTFYNCGKLTSIELSDGVERIGYEAFNNCSNLASIRIPESVAYIDHYAFYMCRSLTSIYITNIESWCAIDFYGTVSNPLAYGGNLYINDTLATDITIPNSLTSISNYAFFGCGSLVSITIPDSVTNLGCYTFSGCSNLKNINIPKGVTIIDFNLFQNCSSLANITIPDGVTEINDFAFSGCSSLASINIPKSVTSLGFKAFTNCDGLTGVYITDLEDWFEFEFTNSTSNPLYYAHNLYINGKLVNEITIPDSVTVINYMQFIGCTSLTTVNIHDGVKRIGEQAFYGCSNLTSINIPESVTSIGQRAFYGCSNLTSINIPESVTSIGQRAFYGCTGVIRISSFGVSYVDNWVVECDTSADSVGLDSNTIGIADFAFANCSNLTHINLNNYGIKTIGAGAFSGCSSLTTIAIPSSVTRIGSSAFYGCSGLASITIPGSVTSVDTRSLFGNCSSLTSITLPNVVTSIGSSAFYGCSSLESIIIPNSVQNVGENAFYGCKRLVKVYYGGTLSDWNAVLIDGTNQANLKLINATRYYYSETEPTAEGDYWHYVDSVPTTW